MRQRFPDNVSVTPVPHRNRVDKFQETGSMYDAKRYRSSVKLLKEKSMGISKICRVSGSSQHDSSV